MNHSPEKPAAAPNLPKTVDNFIHYGRLIAHGETDPREREAILRIFPGLSTWPAGYQVKVIVAGLTQLQQQVSEGTLLNIIKQLRNCLPIQFEQVIAALIKDQEFQLISQFYATSVWTELDDEKKQVLVEHLVKNAVVLLDRAEFLEAFVNRVFPLLTDTQKRKLRGMALPPHAKIIVQDPDKTGLDPTRMRVTFLLKGEDEKSG